MKTKSIKRKSIHLLPRSYCITKRTSFNFVFDNMSKEFFSQRSNEEIEYLKVIFNEVIRNGIGKKEIYKVTYNELKNWADYVANVISDEFKNTDIEDNFIENYVNNCCYILYTIKEYSSQYNQSYTQNLERNS